MPRARAVNTGETGLTKLKNWASLGEVFLTSLPYEVHVVAVVRWLSG